MNLCLTLIALPVCTTIAINACAMENEPNGFREVEWGTPVKGLPWLYNESPIGPHIAPGDEELYFIGKENALGMGAPRLAAPSKPVDQPIRSWVEQNIRRVVRCGDKGEFGGVPANVSYIFFKGRFVAATLRYQTQSSEPSMPRYQNKSMVFNALNRYFGNPDYKKHLFTATHKPDDSIIPLYAGKNTSIRHTCQSASQSPLNTQNCVLIFESTGAAERIEAELTAFRINLTGNIQKDTTKHTTKKTLISKN